MLKILVFLIVLLLSNIGRTHPNIVVRIDKLSSLIKQTPENAQLYIKRGLLYQEHNQWKLALDDFKLAKTHGVSGAWIDYYKAGLLRKEKQNRKAKKLYFKALSNNAASSNRQLLMSLAHLNLAEIFSAEKNWLTAAQHYLLSLDSVKDNKNTSIYLATAQAFKKAGIQYYDSALNVLDRGIAKFPGIISYYDLAITIEMERKNYPSALIRVEKILKKYPRLKSKQVQLRRIKQKIHNENINNKPS